MRLVCPHCIEPDAPSRDLLSESGLENKDLADWRFVAGRGCRECRGAGYHGRKAIAELLVLNDEIRELIGRAPIRDVKDAARRNGTRSRRRARPGARRTARSRRSTVSRLWPRRVCAALFADRVAWAARARGPRRRVLAQGIEPAPGPGGPTPWRGATQALATVLDANAGARSELVVLLSGLFARPLLVPWSAEIRDDTEGAALVAHHFRRVFGDESSNWEFAFDRDADGPARLACAVERGLLAALRETAGAARARLVSVEPLLVSAVNQWRRRIGRQPTLLLVAEAGRYCAATFREGTWDALRCGRIAGNDAESLREALEREAALAGTGALELLAYAPEHPELDAAPEMAHRLTRLAPRGSAAALRSPAAFALGGLA